MYSKILFYANYDAILYHYAWLVIPILINGLMLINQVMKYYAGFALGPIIFSLLIIALVNGFKDKYYFLMTQDDLYFIVMDTYAVFKISSSQIISITARYWGASFVISYAKDPSSGKMTTVGSGKQNSFKFK
ncbi:MAG: hypothetical protein Q8M92_01485 [Candidatus Subteraquimicrobiales bacterium]|nr:hypothetical protein [Candidatus Subteraquimicrobiales bacterium]